MIGKKNKLKESDKLNWQELKVKMMINILNFQEAILKENRLPVINHKVYSLLYRKNGRAKK